MLTDAQRTKYGNILAAKLCTEDITLLVRTTQTDGFGVPLDRLVPYQVLVGEGNAAVLTTVTAKGIIWQTPNSKKEDLRSGNYSLVYSWNAMFGYSDTSIPADLAGVQYGGKTWAVDHSNAGETDNFSKLYVLQEPKSDEGALPTPPVEDEEVPDEGEGS